jgi:peptide/nickel transport system ATP-binding protein
MNTSDDGRNEPLQATHDKDDGGASLPAHGKDDSSASAPAHCNGTNHEKQDERTSMRMPRDRPLLEVIDLRVEFPNRRGTLTALDGISFTIAPGEVLGVVGESGAGKSLTGAAIIGLLEPPGRIAGGEIRLQGLRIDNLPASELRKVRGREIGAIFQDPLTSLNPLYTVGRQLIETIQAHLNLGRSAARERAIELLRSTGIPAPEERIDHYPHQFSGGMRQRVVIALALAAEPKLVIADEPTTALDVSIQAQIIDLLRELCRRHGTAVMLVTHDMGVIAETADRVAVMYAGRIAEIGPVAEVIHRPRHPYTAGLMGSIPSLGEARDRLEQIDGSMPRLDAIPPGCAFNPRCPKAMEICRSSRPPLMSAGSSQAACWLHDPAHAGTESAFQAGAETPR